MTSISIILFSSLVFSENRETFHNLYFYTPYAFRCCLNPHYYQR